MMSMRLVTSAKVSGKSLNKSIKKLGFTTTSRELCSMMDYVIRNNPNVVPVCTMSSIGDLPEETDVNDKEDENLNEQDDDVGNKKKIRRKSGYASTAVVEFLNHYTTEYKTNEKERLDLLKRMHDDTMEVMNRFLKIMESQHHAYVMYLQVE